jgi:CRISPR-associated protein Csb3
VLACFENESSFLLVNAAPLKTIVDDLAQAELIPRTPADKPQTPLWLGSPFNLLIDWWRYEGRESGKLKTWAGQMSVCDIALDMRRAMKLDWDSPEFVADDLLEASSWANEREPFYFDALRALNASRRDVGFSVDALKKGSIHLKTGCRPAVEFLCLIGLQRGRPQPAYRERGKERSFDYCTWEQPIPVELLSVAVAGQLSGVGARTYSFRNPSRAEDYRAFMPATCRS